MLIKKSITIPFGNVKLIKPNPPSENIKKHIHTNNSGTQLAFEYLRSNKSYLRKAYPQRRYGEQTIPSTIDDSGRFKYLYSM